MDSTKHINLSEIMFILNKLFIELIKHIFISKLIILNKIFDSFLFLHYFILLVTLA